MACLLYAVVLTRPEPGAGPLARLPLGVGDAAVSLIEVGEVSAVVAIVDRPIVATPTAGSVMTYAKVVEALHAERAVLPMRFGCVLDQKADVARLLSERGHIYAEVLRDVEGCVEMGIRLLARDSARGTDPIPISAGQNFVGEAAGLRSGADYLADRKRAYVDADRRVQEMTKLVDKICAALHGLFVKCNHGTRLSVTRSVSSALHFSIDFLVKRESLDSFRQIVQRISRAEPARLLLSGPWPPYNFVEPASLPCFIAQTP